MDQEPNTDKHKGSKEHPLVSIITVVYNGEDYIEQTIKSVLSQTYTNIEYIIIDGGSNDETLNIIDKYRSEIGYVKSEKDTGIYNAMNKGLKVASGEIVAILNADDYYYPKTIQEVVYKFQQSDAAVVYGNLIKSRTLNGKSYFKEIKPDLSLIEKTMPIFHPATFIHKKVYDQVGGFNEKYRLSADYDFIYKVYEAGFTFELLDQPLTFFRLGGASSISCTSYKEGFMILQSYGSPYASQMKKLIFKCKIKNFLLKVLTITIRTIGLKDWNEKRLIKKWEG